MKLIKSPLNYTGGKYRLLPQLKNYIPEDVDTFYDVFAGGLNVGINMNQKRLVANDIQKEIIDLYDNLKIITGKEAELAIDNIIREYELSDQNREGYLKLRDDYNQNKTWDKFYALIVHSFNNQIRFNKSGGFNMPFGKNRSRFNPKLRERFVEFVDSIDASMEFRGLSYREYTVDKVEYDTNDFIYCDPPYLISQATYNSSWDVDSEIALLNMLTELDEAGLRFALSNVLEHKGSSNDVLKSWAKKYNVNYLNIDYSNCSYHKKDRGNNSTVEVIITNY